MRAARVLRNGLLAILGVSLGLGVGEWSFRRRDEGAFPQLNCYAADAELGVTLRPGCTERVRFGSEKNPITDVRIGAAGFRGDVPPTGPDDILVVGDSQAFGLGVQEDQTFARALETTLQATRPQAHVIDLGVPTYGPAEYLRVIERALAERKPTAVVVAINLANDLFEATRPNSDRHAVLDGWAIRKEHAPRSVWSFPGREAVMRTSHLVRAYRHWRGQWNDEASTPSEGGYGDLLDAAVAGTQAEATAEAEYLTALDASSLEAKKAHDELLKRDVALDLALLQSVTCSDANGEFECDVVPAGTAVGSEFSWFNNEGGESTRSVIVTAQHLHRAALLRAYRDDNAKGIAEVEAAYPKVKAAAEPRQKALAAYQALLGNRPVYHAPSTPLTPMLQRLAALATEHHVAVVVAVLPVDVVVSQDEWPKYGHGPGPDLSSVDQLAHTLERRAEELGLAAIDLTPTLRAAEPGAFLDADIHLTPKGHAAVGAALAARLNTAPAQVAQTQSVAALPKPSELPTYAELAKAYELTHGQCVPQYSFSKTRDVRVCPQAPDKQKLTWLRQGSTWRGGAIDAVVFEDVDESMALAGAFENWVITSMSLETPGAHRFTFVGSGKRQSFDVEFDPVVQGTHLEPKELVDAPHPALQKADARYVACAKELPKEPLGPPDADCTRTYAASCSLMLACARGDDFAKPRCASGTHAVGPYGRCYADCVVTHPDACHDGRTCVSRDGHDVCLLVARAPTQ